MTTDKTTSWANHDARRPELVIYNLLDQFEFHKENTDEQSSGLERWGSMLILDGLALSIAFLIVVPSGNYHPMIGFLILGASVLAVTGVWLFAKGASDSVFSEINRFGSSISPYALPFLHIVLFFASAVSAVSFSISYYIGIPSDMRLYLMLLSGSLLVLLLYTSIFAMQAPMRLVLVRARSRFGAFRFELIVESLIVAISLGAVVAVTAAGDPAKVAPFGLAGVLAVVGYYRFKISMAAENYRSVAAAIESVRSSAASFAGSRTPGQRNLESKEFHASFRDLQLLLTPNPFQVNSGVRSFSIWALCVLAARRNSIDQTDPKCPFGGDRRAAVEEVLKLSSSDFALGVARVFQGVLDIFNRGYAMGFGSAGSFKTLRQRVVAVDE